MFFFVRGSRDGIDVSGLSTNIGPGGSKNWGEALPWILASSLPKFMVCPDAGV